MADNSCFLCGLTTSDLTSEHVFPKWLQKRHHVWNEKLDLLNGTTIQYRNITIPCCRSCNNGPLARLEEDIALAVSGGYSASSAIDSRQWYLWAGKIFYGILRKELSLPHDRSLPQEGTILSTGTMSFFSNLHMSCREYVESMSLQANFRTRF